MIRIRVYLLQRAAAIVLLARLSVPAQLGHGTGVVAHEGSSSESHQISYIAMDDKYSEQAVRTVVEVISRRSETTRLFQLIRLNEHEDCGFVFDSTVVHLSGKCLPDYEFGVKTPVLSVPAAAQFGNTTRSTQLTHVSFSDGEYSELPVLLITARVMNWTSAAYVGDTSADATILDRLLRYSRSFDIYNIVSVSKEVHPSDLLARTEKDNVDFVLVHCRSYWCYEVVKKLLVLRDDSGSSIPWLMTETLARNVQNEVVAGSLSVHSTTYGLQKSLPSDPLSAILFNDIPSLEISHSQCKTLDRCSTTIQQQLEVLDFYDTLLVLFNLAAKERTFMYHESLVQYINEANVKGISGRIHFDRVTSKRSYPAIYNVLEISQFLIAKIGVYDTSQSIWLQDLKPLSREHAAKHRRHKRAAKQCKPAIGKFRVTTIREPPFVIYDPNNTLKGEVHNGHYAGYVVDLMEWLKRNLSFTYTMYEPDDMKYGLIDENGNSQGMVGDLLDCKADLAAAAMAITSARSEHIFFTKPYIDAGKTLLAYKGEPKSTGIWAFLNPFDVATRIVVVVCFLGVTAIFFVLGKLSDYSNGNELNSADSQRRVNVTWPDSSLWFLYTTAMQQGPDVVPSMAGKVLVAGWFFFCLVIVATYTANLAAFLTVRSFESTIQSVDDLAAQTEIVYGTVNDSSVIEYFSRSQIEVHRRMYNFIINTDDALVDTVEEAYDRVHYKTKGDYVFIWDEPILHYIASHEPCKSRVVGRSFNSQGYGLAMPRGMPYAHNFSLAVLKMRELGITDRMSKKWLRSGPCSDSETTKDLTAAEEIKITDLLGVFIILSVSVGAALLIAAAELLWWRKMKREKVDVTNAE